MAPVAAIDVGSNSVLLLIADVTADGVRVLEERAAITRLGKGLSQSGTLDPDAARRTLEVLRDYGARARAAGARVMAVGTEALRRARDGPVFLQEAREALGAGLEVIEPAREAALAMRAVTDSFPEIRGSLVVLDVGGGSTEVTVGREGAVEGFVSLPLGTVRQHERHLRHDPPLPTEIEALRAEVDREIAGCGLRPPAGSPVVGVAATVTTLAAVAGRVVPYDGGRIHGSWLSAAEVARQAQGYARLPLAARHAIPGLDPGRADVILAGALLLERLMAWLGVDALRVSDRGLRWGLILEGG